jgi:hypothetical protein
VEPVRRHSRQVRCPEAHAARTHQADPQVYPYWRAAHGYRPDAAGTRRAPPLAAPAGRGVLTVAGLMLRSGAWGVVILPGILFLVSSLLVPANPDADRKRSELERELERELAVYATSALLGSWTYSAFSAPDHDLKLGTGRS